MKDINLLPPKSLLSQDEKKLHKKMIVGIGISFFCLLVLYAGLYGVSFFQEAQSRNLQVELTDLKNQLEADKEKGQSLQTLRQKIKGIKTVRQNQIDFGEQSRQVFQTGSDGTVRTINWSSANKVSVGLELPDQESVQRVLARLGTDQEFTFLKDINVEGFQLNQGGKVSLNYQASFVHEQPSSQN